MKEKQTMQKEINNLSIKDLLKITKRPGIDDLLTWMDENGFYTAPCSGRYHLAKQGGLAEHSMNVLRIAVSLACELYVEKGKMLPKGFADSIILCSLIHDLGKAGQYGKPNYLKTIADPENRPYETNKNLLYIPHEVRSVIIAQQFIELTEDEQFAILYHNGLYGELQAIRGKETPLYMILHFADMWASRVTESENTK